MSLVPAEQVMGLPSIVGAYTEDEVQVALDRASAAVESYCEREFAYVASETVNITPRRGGGGKGQARLLNPPVWNVSTVMAQMRTGDGLGWIELLYYQWTEDGLLYDTSEYYGYNGVTGEDFWSGGPTGQWTQPPSWPFLPGSLQVTYSHGFVLPGTAAVEGVHNLPDGIVSAVIGLTAFYLDNPSGAIESRVGEITNRYRQQSDGPAGWLDEKLLGKYRLVNL